MCGWVCVVKDDFRSGTSDRVADDREGPHPAVMRAISRTDWGPTRGSLRLRGPCGSCVGDWFDCAFRLSSIAVAAGQGSALHPVKCLEIPPSCSIK